MASRSDNAFSLRRSNEALFRISIGGEQERRRQYAPQVHYGFDTENFQESARKLWLTLARREQIPALEACVSNVLPIYRVHGVLIEIGDGAYLSRISHLGLAVARMHGVDRAIETMADAPLDSIMARLPAFFATLRQSARPVSFNDLAAVGSAGGTTFDGILLPFADGSGRLTHAYAIISERERPMTNEEGVLELTADLVAEGKRLQAHNDVLDLSLDQVEREAKRVVAETTATTIDRSVSLSAVLVRAREFARLAHVAEGRSRDALYEALGHAYDFALESEKNAAEFARLLEETGLTRQDRAPMTPIVKLVFGKDCDPTRVTEYAAVLSYAQASGIAADELPTCLRQTAGGIKGIVTEMRRLRRHHSGRPESRRPIRTTTARKLRALASRPISSIELSDQEYGAVLVRREADGSTVVIGELSPTSPLLERIGKEVLEGN